MPSYDLEGKAAVVTGAGRGIGRAIALRLAREGASVTVSDLDEGNARQVADEIAAAGGGARANRADVTQKADAEQMVRETVDHFGRVPGMAHGLTQGGRHVPETRRDRTEGERQHAARAGPVMGRLEEA